MSLALQNSPQALQLLQSLGLDPNAMMHHIKGIQRHAGALRGMLDQFGRSANMSTGGLQNLIASGAIPSSNLTSMPNSGHCNCGNFYAPPPNFGPVQPFGSNGQQSSGGNTQTLDFGAVPGLTANSPMALQNRINAMKIEKLVQSNPAAKQALEASLGGRIINDGRADGVMRVQRAPQGLLAPGTPSSHSHALGSLGGIQRGAASTGLANPFGPQAYNALMAGALANVFGFKPQNGGGVTPHGLGGPQAGGRNPSRRLYNFELNDKYKAPLGGIPGMPGAMPAGGGGGVTPHGLAGGGGVAPAALAGGGMVGGGPAANAGITPHGFMGGGAAPANFMGGGGGINNIMAGGGGLTVEDQVVLLLMQISKDFDKKIQAQAQKVQQLQQQQGGKGGGGSSIDVETMKLKRMIDKRGQMFDMLRQIIDKYNETAKNMIQAVGR